MDEEIEVILIDPKNRKVVSGVIDIDLKNNKATICEMISFSKNNIEWNVTRVRNNRFSYKKIDLRNYIVLNLDNLKILN